MTNDPIVLPGTVKVDGTLELPGKVQLPPGPVEVTIRPARGAGGENLLTLLHRIRAEQQAQGYVPRSREEIDEDVRQMRAAWETLRGVAPAGCSAARAAQP